MEKGTGHITRYAKVLFPWLCSFLIGFFMAEIVTRYVFHGYATPIERKFHKSDFRKPYPYFVFSGKQGSGILNELGFVGPVPNNPKPPDEYRVLIFGGSTVLFGEPPISKLLEDEFREHGFDGVRVYSFGVLSSVSGQDLARLLYLGVDFEPDLVIMYNGGNDISQSWFYDPRPGYPMNYVVHEANPLLESDIRHYPLFTLIAYGSNFLRNIFPEFFLERFVDLRTLREDVGYNTLGWREKIGDAYIRFMVKASLVSASHGATFRVFLQPTLESKKNLTEEERQVRWEKGQRRHFEETTAILRRRLKDALELGQIKGADLTQVYLNDHEQVFSDVIHTLQEKKHVVVKAILESLKSDPEIRVGIGQGSRHE